MMCLRDNWSVFKSVRRRMCVRPLHVCDCPWRLSRWEIIRKAARWSGTKSRNESWFCHVRTELLKITAAYATGAAASAVTNKYACTHTNAHTHKHRVVRTLRLIYWWAAAAAALRPLSFFFFPLCKLLIFFEVLVGYKHLHREFENQAFHLVDCERMHRPVMMVVQNRRHVSHSNQQ